MNKVLLGILAKISLVIFAFLLLYYFIPGVTTKVWEGDSIGYHVPISQMILNGTIFNPAKAVFPPIVDKYVIYSPGATEIILSIFGLLHIPLNLFDLVGIVFLFFVMRAFAKSYDFSDNLSIIFATSIASLHTIMRWILSQTIDMWLVSFFVLSIILLRNPRKSYRYFLSLGAALGMFFGTKYSAPIFTIFLLAVFGKNVLKTLNLKRLVVFLVPFFVFGLSWYIRNYILTGDPYYPKTIPFFNGVLGWNMMEYPVWTVIFKWSGGFLVWINAFISEYTVWSLAILAVPVLYFILHKYLNKTLRQEIAKLILVAYPCFFIYLSFPSGPYPNLVTSGFRYTYTAMIPLILSLFIFAKRFAKEEILGLIAITNMLIFPELSYHPKILVALIPEALVIFYPSKIEKFYETVKKRYAHRSA
jgi:hypothetical protein